MIIFSPYIELSFNPHIKQLKETIKRAKISSIWTQKVMLHTDRIFLLTSTTIISNLIQKACKITKKWKKTHRGWCLVIWSITRSLEKIDLMNLWILQILNREHLRLVIKIFSHLSFSHRIGDNKYKMNKQLNKSWNPDSKNHQF